MGRRYNWLCAIVAGFGSALYGYDAIVIASTYESPNTFPGPGTGCCFLRWLTDQTRFAQQGFLTTFKPDASLLGFVLVAN
jgi:hypothetical protein